MENLTEKHRQTVSENKKKQWVSRGGRLGWDFKCSVQPQTSSFHHVCLRFISRRASQFVAQVNLGHKSVWTLHFMIILAPLYILISYIITLFSVFSVTSVNQRRYIGVAGIRPTAAKTVSRLTGPGNTRDNARGQWGKMIETRDVAFSIPPDLNRKFYLSFFVFEDVYVKPIHAFELSLNNIRGREPFWLIPLPS